jgi:hypothetical protein
MLHPGSPRRRHHQSLILLFSRPPLWSGHRENADVIRGQVVDG